MSEKQSTGPTSQFKKSSDVELGTAVINKVTVTTYKSKVRDLKLRSNEWLPKWKSPDQHYFGKYFATENWKQNNLRIKK
jgi:hypothetical protein